MPFQKFTWQSLVVVYFVALTLLKPFFLGFYHDDWATIVGSVYHGFSWSSTRLGWTIGLFPSRPISGLILYVLSSLVGKSALLWQFCGSALSLVLVVVFARFLQEIGKEILKTKVSMLSTLFFASFLFLLPWSLGGFLFLTAAFEVIPSTIFFLAAGLAGFQFLRQPRKSWLLACATFYLLSSLTYETFYFQFVILLALFMLCNPSSILKRNRALVLLIVLFFVQLLSLGLNRYVSTLPGSGSKPFNVAWLPLFLYTLLVLPLRLESTVNEFNPVIRFVELGYLASVLLSLRILLKRSSRYARLCVILLTIFIVGIVTSVFTYALAGYGVTGEGIFSRTAVVTSFYSVCLLFVIDTFSRTTTGWARKVYQLSFISLVAALLISGLLRVQEWVVSWEVQNKVIASAPVAKIRLTDPEAIIVYRGPTRSGGVTIFEASWDISGAVNYSYSDPSCASINVKSCEFRQYTVARGDWVTVWQQEQLVQKDRRDGHLIWALKASGAWLWDFPSGSFTRLPLGKEI